MTCRTLPMVMPGDGITIWSYVPERKRGKGGPGITRSGLLVINKIDLAPLVGASLEVMETDTKRMRGKRPFVFSNLKSGHGADQIARFIVEKGGLARSAA